MRAVKEYCILRFTVGEYPCQFRYQIDNKTVLDAVWENQELTVQAWYSSHELPLVLRGTARVGDAVQFRVQTYRLQLLINGTVVDEEWPYGDPLFLLAFMNEKTKTEGGEVELRYARSITEEEEPVCIGQFENAEGWRPGNGVWVGDCMPYAHEDRYHVLYLKDRHHHRSKWGKGAHQWAHISSADLKHWDIHPMAVEIDDPMEGSICTGSWICENGQHQLYYTVRMADGSSAPICRSLSEDGYHYQKDKTFAFKLSEAYTGVSARDPKVVRGDDGLLHMFVTTTEISSAKGCLVHLVSEDGDVWEEQGTIYTAPDADEPECSDYFYFNGWYYLIFSHHGKGQYRYSRKPFSEWIVPQNQEIPCESVPKAAVWKQRIIFAGFKRVDGYAGTMTFMEALQKENGELQFQSVFG